MLTTQRICMIVVAALGVIVGYFGSSIVSIMEDIGAPCGAALVPIFCGLFFWKEKMNAKGTLTTIVVAVVATLGYWLAARLSSRHQPLPVRSDLLDDYHVCRQLHLLQEGRRQSGLST